MKSLFALLPCFFLAAFIHAQGKYTIHGQVSGVPDSALISLYQDDGSVLTMLQTDTLLQGRFSFEGHVNEPTPLLIMSNSEGFPPMWRDIWVAPGAVINVSGQNKLVRTWQVNSPVKAQQEINEYTTATAPLLDQAQMTATLRKQQINDFFKNENLPAEKKQQIKRSLDSLQSLYDSVFTLIELKEIAIMQQRPVSTVWLKKLKNIAIDVKYGHKDTLRAATIALYNRMTQTQQAAVEAQEVYVQLFPPVVVKTGEHIADGDLKDLQGKIHHLADYKGKYVLLDFWSAGCGPCLMAMPELKTLSDSLQTQLTIVSLNTDSKKSTWQQASKHEAISWVNLSDGKGTAGLAARYGVMGIPHYVIISPEGKVLDAWVGYEKGLLKAKLKKHTTL